MTRKTELLDLPNELFPFIFQHLKSNYLVEAFSSIESCRIQSLIQPFISYLDISQESNQWIDNYLPNLLQMHHLFEIRLQDKHMNLILNYFPSNDIRSMHVICSDWTTDTLKQNIDHCRKYIKKLLITFINPHGKDDIAKNLFQTDSQIEYLTITGRFLYFNKHDINTCIHLKYLSIELEGIHRVLILIEHLPHLEELKVKLRNEERIIEPTLNTENVISTNRLKRITFTGCTKYFEHIEYFFGLLGSKIEHLTIDIDLMYSVIDGRRFEKNLLNMMPSLLSLDLIIYSSAVYCDPIDLETFRSLAWEKFNPILYWYDKYFHQHTIFTWPYKSNRFKHLSNDFISTCTSNRPVSLCFERVRTLSLMTTTPFTLETFQSIERMFPNMKALELTNPIKFSAIDDEYERNRVSSHINNDLLSNRDFKLLSITKFSFLSRLQYDDYKTFRRFIHLLPNLTCLQMFIGRSLVRDILKYEHEDNLIKNSLVNIKLLQMVRFYDEKNVLNNEDIHCIFPNAQILFDYDNL